MAKAAAALEAKLHGSQGRSVPVCYGGPPDQLPRSTDDLVEKVPICHAMDASEQGHEQSGQQRNLAQPCSPQHTGDTPMYQVLMQAGLLTTMYRKRSLQEGFQGLDALANSSKVKDLQTKCLYGYFCLPVLGCAAYHCTHTELFVPAGHVGLLMDEKQEYIFAGPGMHNIFSVFVRTLGIEKLPVNDCLQHGNRWLLNIEQGFIGVAFDNGNPVLLPPGIHVVTSDTFSFRGAKSMNEHKVHLGPYTLLTVDEGYAAVTQNNGKQQILSGGGTHLLDHAGWRFEKFLSLKIQTDKLDAIKASSADNITMTVTSTVTWRIVDPTLAATMAAETMAMKEKDSEFATSDLTNLREYVLKQAVASLAGFVGGVNFSDTFLNTSRAQRPTSMPSASNPPTLGNWVSLGSNPGNESGRSRGDRRDARQAMPVPEAALPVMQEEVTDFRSPDNPLYDAERMGSAVAHANTITMSYGVEILSFNILSAMPVDDALATSLASGALASAEALQKETAARGSARAMRIDAEARADHARIEAAGLASADVLRARAQADAAAIVADGNKRAGDLLATSQVAVDLAKIDKSASLIGTNDKFFFAQEPAYLSSLVLKGDKALGKHGVFG